MIEPLAHRRQNRSRVGEKSTCNSPAYMIPLPRVRWLDHKSSKWANKWSGNFPKKYPKRETPPDAYFVYHSKQKLNKQLLSSKESCQKCCDLSPLRSYDFTKKLRAHAQLLPATTLQSVNIVKFPPQTMHSLGRK